MKQRVREQGGSLLCARPLCWQLGFALHICWSGELGLGCIAGSFSARLVYPCNLGCYIVSATAIHCKSCWIVLIGTSVNSHLGTAHLIVSTITLLRSSFLVALKHQ